MQEFKQKIPFTAFIIAIVGLAAIILLPSINTTASDNALFAKLVPECSSISVGGKSVTNVCTICDLFKLIQNILNFAWIYITFPVAALMLAIGGFMMLVPGLSGEKGAGSYSKGKKIITNALLGIVIVFMAWLGIDTIMKAVHGFQYNEGGGFGPWNAIQCQSQPLIISVVDESNGSTNSLSLNLLNDAEVRQALSSQPGITVLDACPAGISSADVPGGCAVLSNVTPKAIAAVNAFKTACGCPIKITGGSGDKIYLENTPVVKMFIEITYITAGLRVNDGSKLFKAPNGIIFAL
ncbi:MAG: hypothetical protein UX07_C0023G0004 [Parcubacteria group bacterium GW2011_GWA2_45_30]|nr:MAG: hypothetical protein UX07_C0023G0004 [Parcubacteria group bacterium GW2011_GWA2_45_30]HIH49081.1 hypothetical protein [Candidatus Woesearchaeota archaeon]